MSMRFNSGVAAVLLLVTVADGLATEQKGTAITVFVDISQSFAPLSSDDVAALAAVAEVIARAPGRSQWPTPLTIYWSTITSQSLFGTSVCGPPIRYQPVLIRRQTDDKALVTNRKALALRLDECIRAIVQEARLRPSSRT